MTTSVSQGPKVGTSSLDSSVWAAVGANQVFPGAFLAEDMPLNLKSVSRPSQADQNILISATINAGEDLWLLHLLCLFYNFYLEKPQFVNL